MLRKYITVILVICVVNSLTAFPTRSFVCEEDGFFPDPLDCSAYFVCTDGQPEWEQCPLQLQLRWVGPQNVYCDLPERVRCISQTRPYHDMPATTIRNKPLVDAETEEFCPQRENGLYAGDAHCSHFIMCTSGERLDYFCPSGMSFRVASGVCARDPHCIKEKLAISPENYSGGKYIEEYENEREYEMYKKNGNRGASGSADQYGRNNNEGETSGFSNRQEQGHSSDYANMEHSEGHVISPEYAARMKELEAQQKGKEATPAEHKYKESGANAAEHVISPEYLARMKELEDQKRKKEGNPNAENTDGHIISPEYLARMKELEDKKKQNQGNPSEYEAHMKNMDYKEGDAKNTEGTHEGYGDEYGKNMKGKDPGYQEMGETGSGDMEERMPGFLNEDKGSPVKDEKDMRSMLKEIIRLLMNILPVGGAVSTK